MEKTIIIALAIGVLSIGCKRGHKKREEKAKLLVTTPIKKDTVITKEYVCQLRAIQHIELRALEKGYLKEIFVDEGHFVKKGQLMFRIMPLLYKAELEKAKAETNFAEIEYLNTKTLADSNVVSSTQLALEKAKYQKAKAEQGVAEARLKFTELRAPFDGLMDRFQVRLGSLLDEGDLLTTLSDNSKMWVYFNVPEMEYLNYKSQKNDDGKAMKVQLRMANHEIYEHIGEVKTIEADFNNETGNIAFRATFDNPDFLLRHGETGNVILTEPLKNALLIPQKASFQVLDKNYVYVIGKDNVVRAKFIEVEAELPHIFAVKEGLSEGDKILLEGLRKVRDGDEIEYREEEPESVLSHLGLYAE
ncbi:Efflux transporter, RND family, MFP subunit [Elysia marginata]|uniref:Efflux transporter, RND family, MFP subunit n=1 Tax=Elysia marginata TaxID=1093978 RepID=A0AAV4F0S1_9GAST|nr:Efflux transporter, RND family, MFP subunit [Elysia marginata]